MPKIFLLLGSIFLFLGVALGAFAAHILKEKLPSDLFNVFEVGVRYHMYHALGLLAIAWVIVQFPEVQGDVSGWFFIAGIIIFSGSLYSMSLSGLRWLGAITPIGGVCFLIGWGWLAWKVWKAIP